MPRPVEEQVVETLRELGETLGVAESCTGGLVCSLLTDVPGASDVLVEGVVAYRSEVKVRELGVDADAIEDHGVVSAPVAEAMAAGILERADVDRAVATTGIAGPTGGTDATPVGTLLVGLAGTAGAPSSRRHRLEGDRRRVKEAMARQALADLLDVL